MLIYINFSFDLNPSHEFPVLDKTPPSNMNSANVYITYTKFKAACFPVKRFSYVRVRTENFTCEFVEVVSST